MNDEQRRALDRRSDLIACILIVFFVAVAWLTSGCTTGALRHHATVALVAMTAENIAEDAYLAHLDHSLAACEGERACLDREVESHRPAEAVIELVRLAVGAYSDGIALAAAAEESGDAMQALIGAALRLLTLWGDLARALLPLGVTLPALPGGGA